MLKEDAKSSDIGNDCKVGIEVELRPRDREGKEYVAEKEKKASII